MGYTHYWRRTKRLERRRFDALIRDTKIIFEAVQDYKVLLAGPLGEGAPIADSKQIAFNGLTLCNHPINTNIVIPWPNDDAGGIAQVGEDVITGEWHAGAVLSARICNGDCSYESFIIPRILKPESWQQPSANGLYGDFCKTAYRPYDLAVTAVLIAAKHHLRESIEVFSDGTDAQWWDAKLLCYSRLGYGSEYVLDPDRGLIRGYFNLSDEIADANLAEIALREQQAQNSSDCDVRNEE